MKFPLLSTTLASFSLFAGSLAAQDSTPDFDPIGEHDDLPRLIRVQVEFIEMPHEAMTELLKKPRNSANDTDLRAACDKLIEKKEATVLETMSVNALPGQSATVESISEHIYATEYEPSEIAQSQTLNTQQLKQPLNRVPWGMTPPTPSAFDTKNLGSTLEVEAQIDQASSFVELRLTPTIVYFTGFETWGEWKMNEIEGTMKMPTYYVLSVKTGTTLIPGHPQMIAAQSPKDNQGVTDHTRKIMVFVRTDVLTVGK